VVIGLAAGGLTLGLQVLGSQQSAVAGVVRDTQQTRTVETWLERRFAERAPFRSHEPDRFAGDADRFRFDCGGAEACEVQVQADAAGRRLEVTGGDSAVPTLRLSGDEAVRFVYRGAGTPIAAWPPQGAREALRSVSLVQGAEGAEQVLFEARIRLEQPLDCQFDPVMQDCR